MTGLPLGWDDDASQPQTTIGFRRPKARDQDGGGGALVEDCSDAHVFVCAPTGTGKSRAFGIPALLRWTGGVIAVDVKGELYNTTARFRRTLGPVVAIDPFRLVSGGDGALNPLSDLDPCAPQFVDDVYALASLFANEGPVSSKDGRFWEDWGVDVIAGAVAHVASADEESDRSLGRVFELLNSGDTVFELAKLLDTTGKHPFTQSTIGRYLSLPDVTRGGVTSMFNQQMRLLASEPVRASFARNEVDPAAILEGRPFTIYVNFSPDMLESHAALIRVILSGLVKRLTRRRHKPQTPTLILVDEAAQIGAVPALVSATTLGRGYGVRIAWILQSYGQLEKAYPRDHEAIHENCATAITFGKHSNFSVSRKLSETVFAEMSARAIYAVREALVRTAGETRVLRKVDYLKDKIFEGLYDANPLHERPRA